MQQRTSAAKRHGERGQALVESTLVLLVMAATLIGVLDIGQVLFIHQGIVERTRNAVRFGSVHYNDTDAIRNMVLYNQAAAPPRGVDDEPPVGFMGLRSGMVTVERKSQATNDERIVITVSGYPVNFFSPWIAKAFSGRPIVASAPVEIE